MRILTFSALGDGVAFSQVTHVWRGPGASEAWMTLSAIPARGDGDALPQAGRRPARLEARHADGRAQARQALTARAPTTPPFAPDPPACC